MLFVHFDVQGLAMASDLGILMHTVVLAWLLDRKKLVLLSGMSWLELMKALGTAVFAGLASYGVGRLIVVNGRREADLLSLALIGVTWLAAVALGLWLTKSDLPGELRRKKAPATPNLTAPEQVV
jgi:putative peptidoglycan lipid II flippase